MRGASGCHPGRAALGSPVRGGGRALLPNLGVPSSQGGILTPGGKRCMAAPAALEDAGALGSPTGRVPEPVCRKNPAMTGARSFRTHVHTQPCSHPHSQPRGIPSPEDGWARTGPGCPLVPTPLRILGVVVVTPGPKLDLWDGVGRIGTGKGWRQKAGAQGSVLQVGRRGQERAGGCPSTEGKSNPRLASHPQGSGCWWSGGTHGRGFLGRMSSPSQEAEGTGCPCSRCRLEPSPSTAPRPAAAHTGGCGSDIQPRALLCRQRNTPGGQAFLLLLFIGFFLPPPPLNRISFMTSCGNNYKCSQKNETRDASVLCQLGSAPAPVLTSKPRELGAARPQLHTASAALDSKQAGRDGQGKGTGVGGGSWCLKERKEWGAAAVNCSLPWWHSPGYIGSSVRLGFTPGTRTLLPASPLAPVQGCSRARPPVSLPSDGWAAPFLGAARFQGGQGRSPPAPWGPVGHRSRPGLEDVG